MGSWAEVSQPQPAALGGGLRFKAIAPLGGYNLLGDIAPPPEEPEGSL